MQHKL